MDENGVYKIDAYINYMYSLFDENYEACCRPENSQFKILVGKVLENFLPSRFGVCEGKIITDKIKDLSKTPKDEGIIIYDKDFYKNPLPPALEFVDIRGIEILTLDTHDCIALDAILVYIEAENYYDLDFKEDTSFMKAVSNIKNIKQMEHDSPLSSKYPYPPFGAVISRHALLGRGNKALPLDDEEAYSRLSSIIGPLHSTDPDVIVVGKKVIRDPKGNEVQVLKDEKLKYAALTWGILYILAYVEFITSDKSK